MDETRMQPAAGPQAIRLHCTQPSPEAAASAADSGVTWQWNKTACEANRCHCPAGFSGLGAATELNVPQRGGGWMHVHAGGGRACISIHPWHATTRRMPQSASAPCPPALAAWLRQGLTAAGGATACWSM